MTRQNECATCAKNEAVDFEERLQGNAPTNWWHCGSCNEHLERYRGENDISCRCGAEYNSGGQRLRDDWRRNASLYDDDIGDLDGYEIAHAGDE